MRTLSEQATQILRDCSHPTGHKDVRIGSEWIDCCPTCWNLSYEARKAARKAELAARPRDCMRCASRVANYVALGRYKLCGRCLKATQQEHYRALNRAGIFAYAATGPMFDTTTWKGIPR